METPLPSQPAPLTPLGARTPHTHPGLYAVITGLVIVIIVGTAWVFWPESSETPEVSPNPDMNSDWKLFESKLLPLSFRYPPDSIVMEDEYLTAQGIEHTGKQIHYGEANGHFPPFDVITDDFTAVDSTPHDIVDGPLDSATSFHVTVLDEQYEVITEVEPDMYRVDGYGNIECSPFISSLLVVRPPSGSGLEYIQFYLGSIPDFEESDMRADDTCSPTDETIRLKLTALANDRNIAQQLELARNIARTFKATGKTADIEYRNDQYGLSVKLPKSWIGYTDASAGMDWTAYSVATGNAVVTGPMVVVQHPAWTMSVQRQDIPIMVFTIEQWSHVGQPGANEWSVGAAPIPPSELARNSTYVFALPARYNYAYQTGWEEVDELLKNGAATAFQIEPMGLVKRTASEDLVFFDGWTTVSGTFGISNPARDEFGSSLLVSFSADDATSSRIPREPGDDRDAWFRLINDASARRMLGIRPELFDNQTCAWQGGSATIEIGDYVEDLRQTDTSDRATLLRVVSIVPPTCSAL